MAAKFSCLAVETATEVCSIAACVGDRVSVRNNVTSRAASQRIYESVCEALDEIGLQLGTLDCIAFGCGPGGFTGLRVGAAVVQALAYGISVPVCRISSLATMAAGAVRKHQASLVATCLDARMGEAYLALYEADDGGSIQVRIEDCLVNPGDFEIDSRRNFFAAGSGWKAHPELYAKHAPRIDGTDYELTPSAEDLLRLAAQRHRSGQTVVADQALPNYVREKVTR